MSLNPNDIYTYMYINLNNIAVHVFYMKLLFMFQYVQSRKRTKIEYEEEDDTVCKENPVPSKHGHPSRYVTILFCKTRKFFFMELVVALVLQASLLLYQFGQAGRESGFISLSYLYKAVGICCPNQIVIHNDTPPFAHEFSTHLLILLAC